MASPFVTGKRDVPLSQWTVDGNAGHVWEGTDNVMHEAGITSVN